jgi:hypothetical protein
VRAFTLTLGALLAAVVAVNLVGAWSAARDEARVQAVPAALQPGEVVLGYRNVDERRFQRGRLGVIPRPRVVSFGSSRVMQLTGALVGVEPPATFYNLGMSGATVEDYVGLWEILRRQDKIPEMVIFSIDPWVFNADVEQVRWRSLSREIDAFAARREQWAPVELALSGWSRGKELVSYEVLRDSTRRLRRALRGRSAARADAREALVVPEQAVADRQALRADGSLIYDGAFQRRSPLEVQEDAVRWAATNGPGLARLRWNAERLRLLAALWRDMRSARRPRRRLLAALSSGRVAGDRGRRAATRGAGPGASGDRRAGGEAGHPLQRLRGSGEHPCAGDEFFDGQHARPSCLQKLLRLLPTGER